MNKIFSIISYIEIVIILIVGYFFSSWLFTTVIVLVILQLVLGNFIFPILQEIINKKCVNEYKNFIVISQTQDSEREKLDSESVRRIYPFGAMFTMIFCAVGWGVGIILTLILGEYDIIVMILLIVIAPVLFLVIHFLFKKLAFLVSIDEVRYTFINSFDFKKRNVIRSIKLSNIKEIKLYKYQKYDNNRQDGIYEIYLDDDTIWYATFSNFSHKNRDRIKTVFDRILKGI